MLRLVIMTALLLNSTRVFSAELSIEVTGLKDDEGQVVVRLFDNEDAFPGEPEKALATAFAAIDEGKARTNFEDIPSGEYAVAVAHDENGNGELDRNFLGIPKEGLGFSNDAKISLGPPSFDAAKFSITETLSITISMTY